MGFEEVFMKMRTLDPNLFSLIRTQVKVFLVFVLLQSTNQHLLVFRLLDTMLECL